MLSSGKILTLLLSMALFSSAFKKKSYHQHHVFDLQTGRPERHKRDMPPPSMPPSNKGEFKSIAYFVTWAAYNNHSANDIPAAGLTHLMYAFADIKPDGEVILGDIPAGLGPSGENATILDGQLKTLNLLKQSNRNLKLMLSIGGYTWSSNFTVPASSTAGRDKFAKTSVALLQNYGFDGLDIDWEYPENAEQANHFLELLKACRSELNTYQLKLREELAKRKIYRRPYFHLSIAASAGPAKYNRLPLGDIAKELDFINLMAYDYAGSFSNLSAHAANWYTGGENDTSTPFSTEKALDDYVQNGVPVKKLVVGMPLYGHSFNNTAGPGKAFNNDNSGISNYKDLPKANASVTVYKNMDFVASWSYDSTTKEMISFDNKEVAEKKANLIVDQGLGGAMWWETMGDRKGNDSLIQTVHKILDQRGRLELVENELEYPFSKYANLRNKFQEQPKPAR